VDGIHLHSDVAKNNTGVDALLAAYKAKPTEANKRAWEEARDKNEPVKVQAFRRSLQQNAGVKQVIDPWQVDLNTQDSTPGVTNVGQDANAKGHKNHLHITARDRNLIS